MKIFKHSNGFVKGATVRIRTLPTKYRNETSLLGIDYTIVKITKCKHLGHCSGDERCPGMILLDKFPFNNSPECLSYDTLIIEPL